jgi:TctA family transporter
VSATAVPASAILPLVTTSKDSPAAASRSTGVPPAVIVLGIVSFLTDLSSETICAVMPLFLTGFMGASTLIEATTTDLPETQPAVVAPSME